MRVRLNYTIDIDVQQYCDALDEDLTKVQIRHRIQEDNIRALLQTLKDQGVEVELLGRNNVYDPAQKLTVAEHLVTADA